MTTHLAASYSMDKLPAREEWSPALLAQRWPLGKPGKGKASVKSKHPRTVHSGDRGRSDCDEGAWAAPWCAWDSTLGLHQGVVSPCHHGLQAVKAVT